MSVRNKPYVVVTASDARCGDFLVAHWLRSLRANVDLSRIDVVVLDLGLTVAQRSQLEGVRRVPVAGDGLAKIRRYRELARFLAEHDYAQVLAVDAGDVIFQRDLAPLFAAGGDRVRAVVERSPVPLWPFLRGMPPAQRRSVRARLRGRHTINSGFLLGPAKRLRDLAEALAEYAAPLRHDQPIVNCLLHEWGFEPLGETWNFLPWTSADRFCVKEGIFHHADGRRIGVVHNSGLQSALRVVGDFGYGPGYNRRIRRHYLWVGSTWRRLRAADAKP